MSYRKHNTPLANQDEDAKRYKYIINFDIRNTTCIYSAIKLYTLSRDSIIFEKDMKSKEDMNS